MSDARNPPPPQTSPGPARGAAPPPGASPKAAPAAAEEDHWPRRWIVTTSILGIVAVVIVARLFGQAWREGHPRPRPAAPSAAVAGPGKAPPRAGTPKGAASPAGPKVLLALSDVAVPPGGGCIGRDAALHRVDDGAAPHPSCAFVMRVGTKYRVDLDGGPGLAAVQVAVVPTNAASPGLLRAVLGLSAKGSAGWFGGTSTFAPKERVVAFLHNPGKEQILLKQVKIWINVPVSPWPGEDLLSLQSEALPLPVAGAYCVGKDRAAHALQAGQPAPEACRLPVSGANLYHLELRRAASERPLKITLAPASGGDPLLRCDAVTPPVRSLTLLSGTLPPQQAVILTLEVAEAGSLQSLRLLARAGKDRDQHPGR